MSKIDITTRDLFKRLGSNGRTRSARADALFRRLRDETQLPVDDVLTIAPKAVAIGQPRGNAESKKTEPKREN